MALTLWGPFAKGNGQWIAKSILSGFFAAPIEALPEISVSDVFFSHERGTYMGVYAFVLAGSNFFAPVICGFINDGQGYKWVFFYPAMFCGAAFIFLFFFMEETNYDRKTVGLTEKEEDASPVGTPPVEGEEKKQPTAEDLQRATTDVEVGRTYKSKTYLQKLKLWDSQTSRPQRIPYRAMLSLRFLSWPVIFYAGFSYGSYLIWFNVSLPSQPIKNSSLLTVRKVLNGTASLILGGAPYNFSTSMVGLSYLSCCLGVLAASLYTGPLSDWLTIRLARRNGGIMEPEQRLWGFTLCLFVLPASLLLWGVGAAHHVHWFGLIVAMCGTAFCNACGITLSVNYLVDSYREIGGDGMTTVIIIRNTMSFAIGYGITPWFEDLGAQNCFISAAFVGMAACAVFLPMIWYGKGLREKSRIEYWELVRNHVGMGMVH